MTQNRTHTCGELRMDTSGHRYPGRFLGECPRGGPDFPPSWSCGIYYGTTQVVIGTEDMMNVVSPQQGVHPPDHRRGAGAGLPTPELHSRRDRGGAHRD